MTDHKQRNRQQAQRANDATLDRDNELLGADAERARRASAGNPARPQPGAGDDEDEDE